MNPPRSSVPGPGSVGPQLKNPAGSAERGATGDPASPESRQREPQAESAGVPPAQRGKKVSLDPRAYGVQPLGAPAPSRPAPRAPSPEPAASAPPPTPVRLLHQEPRRSEPAQAPSYDHHATERLPLGNSAEPPTLSRRPRPAPGGYQEGVRPRDGAPAEFSPTARPPAAQSERFGPYPEVNTHSGSPVVIGARLASSNKPATPAVAAADPLLQVERLPGPWRRLLREAVLTIILLAIACGGGLRLAMLWD